VSEARPPALVPARSSGAKLAFALAYLGSLAFVTATLDRLPELVASHFGAGGAANALTSRASYARLYLILSGGTPLAIVLGTSWLPRRFPGLSNIPRREFWLAPENRARLHAELDRAGFGIGALTAFFFGLMHWLVLQANERRPPQLDNGAFFAALGTFVAALTAIAVALGIRLRRAGR
jgi:hypothetical protein